MQALTKKKGQHLEDTLDTLGDVRRVLWSSVLRALDEGLGDRKVLLAPKREAPHTWALDQPPPHHSWSIELGLVLDPATAWALLTKVRR